MSVLVGMNFYAARDDALRRQERAIDALRVLRDTPCVNVQWSDERFEVAGIATVAGLTRDARTVTGCVGPRKPIVCDMLSVLARAAEERRCRYFLYANADVEITPEAVDHVRRGGREGYAFVRTDLDPQTGAPQGAMLFGVDAFAFDVGWWQRHQARFRAYIAGEPVWDNVYTAILLSHSKGEFASREGLVRHERHEATPWRSSPYRAYTTFLAALDRPYFSLWAAFHAELTSLRAAGVGEEAERELRERVFTARAARQGWLVQQLRVAKAKARYALSGRRRT